MAGRYVRNCSVSLAGYRESQKNKGAGGSGQGTGDGDDLGTRPTAMLCVRSQLPQLLASVHTSGTRVWSHMSPWKRCFSYEDAGKLGHANVHTLWA